MKISKVFGLVFIFFVFFISLALATPPSEIVLNYDQKAQLLHVEVKHPTKNIREHYIRYLTILLNNVEVKKIRYTHQENAAGFTEEVPVAAVANDVIKAEAICNKGGDKTQELVVGQETK
ncbi:MAG: hypothetical protein HQL24_06045 [Candidatus Omnitrophica bacterium]|nr:hypothetical protein [Candidatus Omnitrophota bacterium]